MSDTTDTDASPALNGPVPHRPRGARTAPRGTVVRSPFLRVVVPSVVGTILIVGGIYSFDHSDGAAACSAHGLAWGSREAGRTVERRDLRLTRRAATADAVRRRPRPSGGLGPRPATPGSARLE